MVLLGPSNSWGLQVCPVVLRGHIMRGENVGLCNAIYALLAPELAPQSLH